MEDYFMRFADEKKIRNSVKKDMNRDKIESKNIENKIRSFDEMPLFLGVNEVSRAFGIGRNSTYELFNSIDFPKIIVAGQFRVCKDDLMTWLDNQKPSKEVEFNGKKKR
jgi:predicted DNA-binding transcriptional regulator AlpA